MPTAGVEPTLLQVGQQTTSQNSSIARVAVL